MSALVTLLSIAVCLTLAWCYPSGAPLAACANFTPSVGHGALPANSTSPYTISVSSGTYLPGSAISVTITGPTFKGFIIEARTVKGSVGRFTAFPNGSKPLNCSDAVDRVVTHANAENKTSLTLTWVAPSGASEAEQEVRFRSAVVQTKTVFWVNIQSKALLPFRSSGSVQGVSLFMPLALMVIASFAKKLV